MMNVDANVDDIKYYVGTSGILESLNPHIPLRHVSILTISIFNACTNSLNKFQCWPHSLLTMQHQWMMLVIGVLEEVQ